MRRTLKSLIAQTMPEVYYEEVRGDVRKRMYSNMKYKARQDLLLTYSAGSENVARLLDERGGDAPMILCTEEVQLVHKVLEARRVLQERLEEGMYDQGQLDALEYFMDLADTSDYEKILRRLEERDSP